MLADARTRAINPTDQTMLDVWVARLAAESGLNAGPARVAGSAAVGYRSLDGDRIAGQLVPREGGDFDYTGDRPGVEVRDIDAALALDVSTGSFTLAADRSAAGDVRGRTRALYALFGTPSLEVWAGRRPIAFGPDTRTGIVLGPSTRLDGLGVELPAGFRLPSFLRHLGVVRLSQSFARLDRSGPIDRPWFLATRLDFAPTPSTSIGLNRAAMFGGTGNQSVTVERVFWMLLGQTDIGSKDSDFENQVASIDFTWRPSTGWTLFGEYGFDDAGGAFLRVPAITVGARLGRLPFLPAFGSTLRFTHMAAHCCGHPPWYQHGILAEGWTDRGVLLGHSLGGEGSQLMLALTGDLLEGRLYTDARVRYSHRGDDNLLAPSFQGSAFGAELHAMLALASHFRLSLDLAGDRFRNGRDRHDAWLALQLLF